MGLTLDEYLANHDVDMEAVERKEQKLLARVEAYELAKARKDAGLTQTDMAKNMGVSQKRISEIEHAHAASIRLGTLQRYATALGGTLNVSIDCAAKDGTMRTLNVPVLT